MSPKRLSFIYMHLSIFLWGFTGVFGRVIQLSAVMLVWYRLLITVIILAIIAAFTKNIKLHRGRDLARLCFIGFCVMVHWILFYTAIKLSNASVGISCISTVAVFTSFLEPVMTGKQFKPVNLILALFAVAGMYMIFSFHQVYRTGILVGLCAAFIGSYFTILNAKLIKEFSSETITFYELGSALFFLTLLLPFYHFAFPAESMVPSSNSLLLLFLFSAVCTVVPFNLSIKALKHISAFTANLSINLEPVYGIFFAMIILQENKELSWGFYAGTGLILASVLIYSLLIGRRYFNRNREKQFQKCLNQFENLKIR